MQFLILTLAVFIGSLAAKIVGFKVRQIYAAHLDPNPFGLTRPPSRTVRQPRAEHPPAVETQVPGTV